MTRFWVSWWSGNYADEGCTRPPFKFWVSGQRVRMVDGREDDERDECSICAVIDAETEAEVWILVTRHFPDQTPRFCEVRLADWVPGSRFP